MHVEILDLLADPVTREPFDLEIFAAEGNDVISGMLRTASGRSYPITDRIPRFVDTEVFATVQSFGDQWNHFNFVQFHEHWLQHTVANTFGSPEAFRDKLVVDAGGGSGAQALWMLEAGAKRVILIELSQSVDDVVKRNLDAARFPNLDVIQASIDAPPLRSGSIDGILMCHNVIQHTRSVETTARALFDLVAPGGEFVFNCYRRGGSGPMTFIRERVTSGPLRRLLSRQPFEVTLAYARVMGVIRLIPLIGWLANKLRLSLTGRVPRVAGESWLARRRRIYELTVLNTFDLFGSHAFQHALSIPEQQALVRALQPDPAKVSNEIAYFAKPQPTGAAIRLLK